MLVCDLFLYLPLSFREVPEGCSYPLTSHFYTIRGVANASLCASHVCGVFVVHDLVPTPSLEHCEVGAYVEPENGRALFLGTWKHVTAVPTLLLGAARVATASPSRTWFKTLLTGRNRRAALYEGESATLGRPLSLS